MKTPQIRVRPQFLWVKYVHTVHRAAFPVRTGVPVILALCGVKIGVDKATFSQPQEKPKGDSCSNCYGAWHKILGGIKAPRMKFAIYSGKNVAHRIKTWFSSKIETRCDLVFNASNATLTPKTPSGFRLCRLCRRNTSVKTLNKALVRDRERSHEAAVGGSPTVSSFQGPSQA